MCLLAACAARAPRPRERVRDLRPEDRLPLAPELDRTRKTWEVVTLVIVGERLWRESCALGDPPAVDGLCLERAPAEGGCGPGVERLVARERGGGAALARMHFRAALERYLRAGLSGGEVDAAAASARLHLADDQLERVLALSFPRDLDFDADEPAALEQLARFRREVDGRTLGARRAYDGLMGSSRSVAALAREALLFRQVAALVRRAELPRRPASEDGDEFLIGFCETMAELAAPWEDGAARLSAACVDEAARRSEPGDACRPPTPPPSP